MSSTFSAINTFFSRKRTSSLDYFAMALRNENDGCYNEALLNYEQALMEQNKQRFRDDRLAARIADKIKVLHTTIDYERNFHVNG